MADKIIATEKQAYDIGQPGGTAPSDTLCVTKARAEALGCVCIPMASYTNDNQLIPLEDLRKKWKPEEHSINIGNYEVTVIPGLYAWGETEEKTTYTRDNYKFKGGNAQASKYNTTDWKYILEPQDDVVQVKYGNGWRLATSYELDTYIILHLRGDFYDTIGLTGDSFNWTHSDYTQPKPNEYNAGKYILYGEEDTNQENAFILPTFKREVGNFTVRSVFMTSTAIIQPDDTYFDIAYSNAAYQAWTNSRPDLYPTLTSIFKCGKIERYYEQFVLGVKNKYYGINTTYEIHWKYRYSITDQYRDIYDGDGSWHVTSNVPHTWTGTREPTLADMAAVPTNSASNVTIGGWERAVNGNIVEFLAYFNAGSL